MSKLISFFLVMLLGTSILGGIMKGGGGIVAAPLASDMTATDTTITMADTRDYLTADYVIIEGERITYSGKTATTLTGCTRGCNDTTASSHETGALVYTADASGINNAVGFNLGAQQDSIGWVAVLAIPFNFFVITVPRIIRMNLEFLTGPLAIIGWVWICMAAGFIITLAIMILGGMRVR